MYRVAVINCFRRNDLNWRFWNFFTAETVRMGGTTFEICRLLLLQNSLQIGGKPDCIRNHSCVESGHVGIRVVVDPLLPPAAAPDWLTPGSTIATAAR